MVRDVFFTAFSLDGKHVVYFLFIFSVFIGWQTYGMFLFISSVFVGPQTCGIFCLFAVFSLGGNNVVRDIFYYLFPVFSLGGQHVVRDVLIILPVFYLHAVWSVERNLVAPANQSKC